MTGTFLAGGGSNCLLGSVEDWLERGGDRFVDVDECLSKGRWIDRVGNLLKDVEIE